MAFRFDVDARDLERKLARLPSVLDRGMLLAFQDIQIRIANAAKATTLFVDHSGGAGLRGSIRPGQVTGSFSRGTLRAEIIAGGGTVTYARFVHDGTEAHDIVPRNKRALRWGTGTGFAFAKSVRHPGTEPRPYMTEAVAKVSPEAPRIVEAYFTRALRSAGLGR